MLEGIWRSPIVVALLLVACPHRAPTSDATRHSADAAAFDLPVGLFVAARARDKPELVFVARGHDDLVWIYRDARYFAARIEPDAAASWRMVPMARTVDGESEAEPPLVVDGQALRTDANPGLVFSHVPDPLTDALADGPIVFQSWIELADAMVPDPSAPPTIVHPSARITLASRGSRAGTVDTLYGIVVPRPDLAGVHPSKAKVHDYFVVTGETAGTQEELSPEVAHLVPNAAGNLRLLFDENGKPRTAAQIGYMDLRVFAVEGTLASTVLRDLEHLL